MRAPGRVGPVGAAGVVLAGQQPEAQRRIGQQRHTQAVQGFVQPLSSVRLTRQYGFCTVATRGRPCCSARRTNSCTPYGVSLDRPMCAHLARLDQPGQGLQLLVDGVCEVSLAGRSTWHRTRHMALGPVDLVQVDHIRLQRLQRLPRTRPRCRPPSCPAPRAPRACRATGRPPWWPAPVFARARGAGQPVADDGLGGAEGFGAGGHRVHLGRVQKLTPRSSERSRMAWASASSTCSPKVMVPRQMGVTCRSLWPSGTVFIASKLFSKGWQ
jgi:hypothetical protein